MELFNVYSLYPIEPVRGKGCYVYDAAGTEYLDLYGGHAVISIGHPYASCKRRERSWRRLYPRNWHEHHVRSWRHCHG